MLMVLTFRPEFNPPWTRYAHVTALTLNRLSHQQVIALVKQLTDGKTLPGPVLDQIVAKTDGVPLFVEELTKMIVTADFMRDAGDQYELISAPSDIAIPATLRDSLMARLDRQPQARQVAQLGAVLGREFSYEMLQAVSSLEPTALHESLSQLVDAEILYQREYPSQARYIFKHALIQDMAYQSLLKRNRQQIHHQVAALLERDFPERAEIEPELVAHHYTQADLAEQAMTYWQQAGLHANKRSAHQEAIGHLSTGLKLLQTLPQTHGRDRQELALQTALGHALLLLKGQSAPEVEATYQRARALCQQSGETRELFLILLGLWRFYNTRADFDLGQPVVEDLIELAKRNSEMPLEIQVHYCLGCNCLWIGSLLSAHEHFQKTITRYIQNGRDDPLFRVVQDPGVSSYALSGMNRWLLGYPDQARAQTRAALALASELNHPYSYVFALSYSAVVSQLIHDQQAVGEYAHAVIRLSSEQGFNLYLSFGSILEGWSMIWKQREERQERIHCGIRSWRATGAKLLEPYFLTLLAEVYRDLGQIKASLELVDEALSAVASSGENWWEAEVYRCKGKLLLHQDQPDASQAESCFRQALDIASQQQAKSLELRAATSLARLWRDQDKRQAAFDLLAPIYNWFTEGFDTADLKDAKALIEEFS